MPYSYAVQPVPAAHQSPSSLCHTMFMFECVCALHMCTCRCIHTECECSSWSQGVNRHPHLQCSSHRGSVCASTSKDCAGWQVWLVKWTGVSGCGVLQAQENKGFGYGDTGVPASSVCMCVCLCVCVQHTAASVMLKPQVVCPDVSSWGDWGQGMLAGQTHGLRELPVGHTSCTNVCTLSLTDPLLAPWRGEWNDTTSVVCVGVRTPGVSLDAHFSRYMVCTYTLCASAFWKHNSSHTASWIQGQQPCLSQDFGSGRIYCPAK